jgi:hypothetical protein
LGAVWVSLWGGLLVGGRGNTPCITLATLVGLLGVGWLLAGGPVPGWRYGALAALASRFSCSRGGLCASQVCVARGFGRDNEWRRTSATPCPACPAAKIDEGMERFGFREPLDGGTRTKSFPGFTGLPGEVDKGPPFGLSTTISRRILGWLGNAWRVPCACA